MTCQGSLFDQQGASAAQQVVAFYPEFNSWRAKARALLKADLAPDKIWWKPDEGQPLAAPEPTSDGLRVPKAYADLARAAACHSNPDRWHLLYQVLWRLTHGEPRLMSISADSQVARLYRYMKAVGRDAHKMEAFVRFRAMIEPGQTEPRYVAWFEPEHHVLRYKASFFRRRFANMRWSILTPLGCMHWEGSEAAGGLWFSAAVDRSRAPQGDQLEDAWRIYYRSIFNPARLKIQAMQSEMPQKYWKNLPEAQLIPQLIREADARVAQMQAQRKIKDEMHCGPRPPTPAKRLAQATQSVADPLQKHHLQLQACQRCPLWEPASQVVPGEGPSDARIMLVGEQPGDQEDLAGRPFVGPAGNLLDQALGEVGLERARLYLTNAVKHFKFTPRGKQRIHSRPREGEVGLCLDWLQQEIRLVDPALVVCLGATAAQALLGSAVRVQRDRGQIVATADRSYLITVHPAHLLRIPNKSSAAQEYRRWLADLKLVAQWNTRNQSGDFATT